MAGPVPKLRQQRPRSKVRAFKARTFQVWAFKAQTWEFSKIFVNFSKILKFTTNLPNFSGPALQGPDLLQNCDIEDYVLKSGLSDQDLK